MRKVESDSDRVRKRVEINSNINKAFSSVFGSLKLDMDILPLKWHTSFLIMYMIHIETQNHVQL